MKRHLIIIATLIVLLGRTLPACANPIIPDMFGTSEDEALFGLVAVFSLLVEYIFVAKFLSPWAGTRHVLPAYVLINIVSFPLTTFLGECFMWLAEIFPIVIEPPMYWLYMKRIGVEVPNLRARIIGANLISFLISVVVYYAIYSSRGG